ncbi:MAG TPA: Gfo/Idh/MocA family oxidoreductase [Anaerohalosphaeraceae bacterium]|nr:Gfo/Idh/MocA family oxidoreductase [Anaerohalosphaeraceae bacterium]HRT52029.1 Gfo/Idh/MocA family oxidoreductase [Anaerohalosphaeraceae bacterium]HRT88105.1 Gfo/Idh/MocA family oxidoreductase [Anaerohalosphaeraceae bacterium]
MKKSNVSRRQFLKCTTGIAASAVAFPHIVPATALGKEAGAPSNRVTMAVLGTGNQGINDLRGMLGDERVQVVAVCDVNRESAGYWDNRVGGREPARRIVEEYYGKQKASGVYKGVEAFADFRQVMVRKDIDTVLIALPDHWHALVVIAAARAGKDIYGEKPLSLTIADGRAQCNAVKRYGRIFQTGSQQRSDANFRRACELVRNGRIGKLHTVKCGLPGGTPDYSQQASRTAVEPVPDGFDYDMWLGPAPEAPYCPARCHVNWRWILDYSGGQVTDWGGHHPDCAQWGMGTEDTGPVEIINAKGTYHKDRLYNTATDYYFECIYANGVKLIVSNRLRGGVTFEGTEGWVWANRGRHDAEPKSILDSVIKPDEIHLYKSENHFRNFIDCVLSRQQPAAPIETAHRSITIAHLGNIAMQLERDLKWDPDNERFVNDPEADKMLSRTMRSPWRL